MTTIPIPIKKRAFDRSVSPVRETSLVIGKHNACKNKLKYFSDVREIKKEWTCEEQARFDTGFVKLRKDFNQIQKQFVRIL